VLEQLDKFDVPTLVFWGDLDAFIAVSNAELID
jgi:hypothetical protein